MKVLNLAASILAQVGPAHMLFHPAVQAGRLLRRAAVPRDVAHFSIEFAE